MLPAQPSATSFRDSGPVIIEEIASEPATDAAIAFQTLSLSGHEFITDLATVMGVLALLIRFFAEPLRALKRTRFPTQPPEEPRLPPARKAGLLGFGGLGEEVVELHDWLRELVSAKVKLSGVDRQLWALIEPECLKRGLECLLNLYRAETLHLSLRKDSKASGGLELILEGATLTSNPQLLSQDLQEVLMRMGGKLGLVWSGTDQVKTTVRLPEERIALGAPLKVSSNVRLTRSS